MVYRAFRIDGMFVYVVKLPCGCRADIRADSPGDFGSDLPRNQAASVMPNLDCSVHCPTGSPDLEFLVIDAREEIERARCTTGHIKSKGLFA